LRRYYGQIAAATVEAILLKTVLRLPVNAGTAATAATATIPAIRAYSTKSCRIYLPEEKVAIPR
jgi:hypothetical protein